MSRTPLDWDADRGVLRVAVPHGTEPDQPTARVLRLHRRRGTGRSGGVS